MTESSTKLGWLSPCIKKKQTKRNFSFQHDDRDRNAYETSR